MDALEAKNANLEKYMNISAGLHAQIIDKGHCPPDPHRSACAQADFVDHLIEYSKDDNFTAEELLDLQKKAQIAGVSDEEMKIITQDFTGAGVSITTKDGRTLEGEAAASYVMSVWEETNEKVEKKIDEVDAAIADLQGKMPELQDDIKKAEDDLAAADDALNAKLNSDNPLDRREAFLGHASVADNMSWLIKDITDAAGNPVHMDHESDDPTQKYYRVDPETNERIYYTNPLEIATFEEEAQGREDGPGMGSWGQFVPNSGVIPPKKFANEKVDYDAYQARWDQKDALAALQEREEALNSAMAQLKDLKDVKDMASKDKLELKRLMEGYKSGEISAKELNDGLENINSKYSDGKDQAQDVAGDKKWSSDEAPALNTPDENLDTIATSINEARRVAELAKATGGTIHPDVEQDLLALPGMTEAELQNILDDNGVKVADGPVPGTENDVTQPGMSTSNQAMTFTLFGQTIDYTPIPEMSMAPDANNIYALGMAYDGCVLDDYPQYNDPNAEYMRAIDNNASHIAPATEMSHLAFSGQSTSSGSSDGPTAEELELERQRLEREAQPAGVGAGAGGAGML